VDAYEALILPLLATVNLERGDELFPFSFHDRETTGN